jgi:xylan 1,4-beta-xylosidase
MVTMAGQFMMMMLLGAASATAAAPPPSISATVTVEAGATPTPFAHFWKRTFGSGHARLTLRADWQAHLKLARDELGLGGVRYHGIFDDDMNVVTAPRTYNFTLIDRSWDYQVSLGLTPVVELSFMPALLADCSWDPNIVGGHPMNPGKPKCHTIMHYQGVTEPPKDFDDWAHLVNALGSHAVERYGAANVSSWNWEVWNEMWGMGFPEVSAKRPPCSLSRVFGL